MTKSTETWTGVVWVLPGESLRTAIERLRGEGASWITAAGSLEHARLVDEPESEGAGAGPCSLVTLNTAATGPILVTLARAGALTGGELADARSGGVHLMVWKLAADATSRLAGAVSARDAADAPPAEAVESDELPVQGDRVLHATFGLCDVMVVRGERLKIRDVNGLKRLREVSLSVLRVLPPRIQDGKRVFPLEKR